MKVLFVCDRLDVRGGLEKIVSMQAAHFAALGHEVRFLTRWRQEAGPAYELPAGVRVDSTQLAPSPSRWRRLPSLVQFSRRAARYIAQHAPDVVILNGADVAVLVLAGLPLALRRRCICCDHNHFTAVGPHWRRLRGLFYRDAGAVVSLTDHDLPAYRAINSNSRRIYNASDFEGVSAGGAGTRRILAIGRFTPQKGFDLLLEAWSLLTGKRQGWVLEIVGAGDMAAELEARRNRLADPDSVQFVAPTPMIAEHYRGAAIYVLSSRYEGFPIVMLEAMSCGLACIAFDCPTGPAELLGKDTECLVPAGNVVELARVLGRAMADDAVLAGMARHSRARGALFPVEGFLQSWAALVDDVARSCARVSGRGA